MTLDERFEAFHARNPQVFQALLRLAYQWRRRRPCEKCSIGMLWEVLRWDVKMGVDRAGDEYKLNNSYRSRYARKLMGEPGLGGLFETRRLHDAGD